MFERKVYVVPIMHSLGEVDQFMVDTVRNSQVSRNRLYRGILGFITDLQKIQPNKRLDKFKVYQDGHDGSQDFSNISITNVQAEDVLFSPQSVVLKIVTELGAKLVVTENKNLVSEAKRLSNQMQQVGLSDQSLEVVRKRFEANRSQRDHSSAKRVVDTLRRDEQGLYFFGAFHEPIQELEKRGLLPHVPLEVFKFLQTEDYKSFPYLLNYRLRAQPLV